jgi:dihydroxyacetone kinase
MKHFINEKDDLVREAISGVLTTNAALSRLDGFPAIKVVLRNDWDRSKVAIISGGGAGHEPAHVGFVGRGMLTAAVSGEVFASPSVDAVLMAILAVTGDAGCLLVVKNYTGDRLNFGLAREKARTLGKKVEMVVVADDIALPDSPHPRGVAGTLFVHKIAGHLAEKGASLEEITVAAERIAKNIGSLGISLGSCTIPGQKAEERMGVDQAELGLGIHGEPGVQKIPLAPARELTAEMALRLGAIFKDSSDRFALLVNGLGGVPNIEMSVVTRCFLETSLGARVDLVVGPAPLMTSLDMKGFSFSLLRLDADSREALASDVAPVAWPRASKVRRDGDTALVPLPKEHLRRSFQPSAHAPTRAVLATICHTLVERAPELDALDAKVGDGDTGSTLATAARAISAELDSLPISEPASLLFALSDRLSTVMGGSSGVLLSIFTAATGSALLSGDPLPRALLAGATRVREVGGAKLGDRTMLDALVPALGALETAEPMKEVARIAREGADKTAAMLSARAGRSSYLSADSLRGVKDPGAVAVALVLEALAGT